MKNTLIVEDLPHVAESLRQVVHETFPDSSIRLAATLKDAFRQLQQTQPDLVLLDIGLPDGEGLQLLKTNALCQQASVIITTIFDDDSHLFTALRLGAKGYLLKDETPEQLTQALQGIALGHPPLSASIAQRILDTFRPASEAERLSPREEDVLLLLAKGYSNREAASVLQLTPNTIAGYIKNIYRKLQINNRAEATAQAIRLGLLR